MITIQQITAFASALTTYGAVRKYSFRDESALALVDAFEAIRPALGGNPHARNVWNVRMLGMLIPAADCPLRETLLRARREAAVMVADALFDGMSEPSVEAPIESTASVPPPPAQPSQVVTTTLTSPLSVEIDGIAVRESHRYPSGLEPL